MFVLFYEANSQRNYVNVTRCLRVRASGVGRRSASGDQCSELHPLQDVRHQGPEPEHQLGGAGRRRRPCIQRHVNTTAIILSALSSLCSSLRRLICQTFHFQLTYNFSKYSRFQIYYFLFRWGYFVTCCYYYDIT